jgi:hypothetical protein
MYGININFYIMNDDKRSNPSYKFRSDYAWPKKGTIRHCPKDQTELQLMDNEPNYYGKPWWCATCQWQYSEEDLISQ